MTAQQPPRTPPSAGRRVPPLARSGIDRAAALRMHDGVLDELRGDPRSRVLVLHGDAAPLADRASPGDPRLHLVAPDDVPDGAVWALLGTAADGRAMLAAVLPAAADEPFAAPGGWAGLRVIGGALGQHDSALFVEALSLGRWLIDAPHCPACGARTELRQAGWSRHCPSCGRQHFPRTDPAVIVAVESEDGERLLLGSNAAWGQDRYSCFAGFVEAGESLEAAVAREVAEECGIRVGAVEYRGSQAWPYPRSLMLGFRARARSDADALADGDEIAQVRWFTRPQLRDALAGKGDATMPGSASIAHLLIEDWAEGR